LITVTDPVPQVDVFVVDDDLIKIKRKKVFRFPHFSLSFHTTGKRSIKKPNKHKETTQENKEKRR